MKTCNRRNQKGFSLLESIISVTLVVLLVNGLFLTWQFVMDKTGSYDQYSQAKESLETAFEITIRNIREARLSTIAISSSKDSISFFKSGDSSPWSFLKSNDSYQMRQSGVAENLITGCTSCKFELNGNMVTVTLSVDAPPSWNDASDLTISGNAFPRN